MLTMLIRVIQAEGMTEFVNKDSSNIANGPPVRETQGTSIRVELLIFVKENISLDNIAS
jgi:hypothetical protein